MAKRLGSKPNLDKPLDWIKPEGREGEGAIPPQQVETQPITPKRKVRAERLSITADPELVVEFNKLCDMWRAAYPNTQKTDICNLMLKSFLDRWSDEVPDVLSG